MEEIARQFREELQELLDRYKNRLTNPQIMHIAQSVFTKTIGIKDNPERINIDISKLRCYSQMIAEADCDGDIKKCGRACFEGEWKYVNLEKPDKDEQLTKAKEIIEEYVKWSTSTLRGFYPLRDKENKLIAKAETFLKENENV